MFPLWGWVLLWTVLVLAAGLVLAWRVRWLWRRLMAFLDELEAAGATLSDREVRAVEVRRAADRVAVLDDPWRLGEEYAAARDAARAARLARREEMLPPWARPRLGAVRSGRT